MTLMTPTEVYDPFYSYSILKQFPSGLKNEVLESMSKEGALIKRNHGARPIPGCRLSLSNKFINDMVGKLPQNMLSQASEYERFLSEHGEKTRFLPAYVSSGMMACLLNLVSNEKVRMKQCILERKILTFF
jgi:hypothetical protein